MSFFIALQPTLMRLRGRLKRLSDIPFSEQEADESPLLPSPYALDKLCHLQRVFSLNQSEQQVLLLCLAAEVDPDFMPLLAQISPSQAYLTLGLVQALMGEGMDEALMIDPHSVNLLSSRSALLTYQLMEKHPNGLGHWYAPIHLSADLLDYFNDEKGIITPLLRGYCQLIHPHEMCLDSEQQIVNLLINKSQEYRVEAVPMTLPILVGTSEIQSNLAKHITSLVAKQQGLRACFMDLAHLPASIEELTLFRQAIVREIRLQNHIILLHIDVILTAEPAQKQMWSNWLGLLSSQCPHALILTGAASVAFEGGYMLPIMLEQPTRIEQRHIWRDALAPMVNPNSDITTTDIDSLITDSMDIERLIEQFSFAKEEIISICQQLNQQYSLSANIPDKKGQISKAMLWQACQQQRQGMLGPLVSVIPPCDATWADIVLLPAQKQVLQAVVSQVQQQYKVYHDWGFAANHSLYGHGISVLLSGCSGTGKTLAARIMAAQLHRDIYQIDLSQVADKYIGETEKKLEQVFQAAERTGAVLLFDEADALFGQRSKISDSKDRHANLGVSYLLQRMEAYQGLAILTTNFKSILDDAFMRRIRYMVHFTFPDRVHRQCLWQQMFPAKAPVEHLDFSKLARLPLSGGATRNIVLHAAFSAASEGQSITMAHLRHACLHEYAKTEKLLDPKLLADW